MGHFGGSQRGFHGERKQDGGAFMAVIERGPRLPGLRTLAAKKLFMPRLECLAELGPPKSNHQIGPWQGLVTRFYFCLLQRCFEV